MIKSNCYAWGGVGGVGWQMGVGVGMGLELKVCHHTETDVRDCHT